MSEGLYEVVALSARYVFAGLMILIVFRAWRITIVDSRRAKTLRRISPETGISGELLVIEGDERARRGMKYPVIREGLIGTSRRADVRIRHSSVRRRHAYFQLTAAGLWVRAHANAPMRDGRGKAVREITLGDGDGISIGRVKLLLVLTEAPAPERTPVMHRRTPRGEQHDEEYDDPDDLFNPDPDRMFRESPVLRHVSEEDDFLEEDPPNARGEEMWWPDEKK